jgi:hypothetical protein
VATGPVVGLVEQVGQALGLAAVVAEKQHRIAGRFACRHFGTQRRDIAAAQLLRGGREVDDGPRRTVQPDGGFIARDPGLGELHVAQARHGQARRRFHQFVDGRQHGIALEAALAQPRQFAIQEHRLFVQAHRVAPEQGRSLGQVVDERRRGPGPREEALDAVVGETILKAALQVLQHIRVRSLRSRGQGGLGACQAREHGIVVQPEVTDRDDDGLLGPLDRPLRLDLEQAEGDDLVVEELDAQGTVARREDIQKAAAAREVADLGDHPRRPVSGLHQVRAQLRRVDALPATQAHDRLLQRARGHHALPQRRERRDRQNSRLRAQAVQARQEIAGRGCIGGIAVECEDFRLRQVAHDIGPEPDFEVVSQPVGRLAVRRHDHGGAPAGGMPPGQHQALGATAQAGDEQRTVAGRLQGRAQPDDGRLEALARHFVQQGGVQQAARAAVRPW